MAFLSPSFPSESVQILFFSKSKTIASKTRIIRYNPSTDEMQTINEVLDREGPRWAHLIWVEVESSHSLLAEVVVWQHSIHCFCEDLCVSVFVSGGRGGIPDLYWYDNILVR